MEAYQLDQNQWGVCGFVAAIQAAKLNGKTNALKDTNYKTLFPVIKTFCESNVPLQAELVKFSASFASEPQYPLTTLANFVTAFNDDEELDRRVNLAMTASALTKLCKDLGFANTTFVGETIALTDRTKPLPYKNAIYGLGNGDKFNPRFGLLHWVYVDATGNLMTWGEKYPAVSPNATPNAVEFLMRRFTKVTHSIRFI